MDIEELPPCVCPTEGQAGCVGISTDQAAKPGISINLQQATEALQMTDRVVRPAILAVEIGRRRMARPAPRPVVHRIAPQPSGLGPPTTGIEHRQGRIIGKHLGRGQHRAQQHLMQRRQPPAGSAPPCQQD